MREELSDLLSTLFTIGPLAWRKPESIVGPLAKIAQVIPTS